MRRYIIKPAIRITAVRQFAGLRSCYGSRASLAEENTTPGANGRVPVVYHNSYSKPVLPSKHRFPMGVFKATYEELRRLGVATREVNCFTPARYPTMDELCDAHDEGYIKSVCASTLDERKVREIGLPWSEDLLERTLMECSGTLLTVDLALRCGLAVHTAGGVHHAHYNRGSGYCVINDLVVASKWVLNDKTRNLERIMIVDLDVHQGDGTASMLVDDTRVFTLSVHAESNFPWRKAKSNRDVGLEKGCEDDEYIQVVSACLRESLDFFRPQLVIYIAGVDVHKEDVLGHLSITDMGLHRREELVLDTVLRRGIPLAGVVGGGYDADVSVLASRHAILHRVAQDMFVKHGF